MEVRPDIRFYSEAALRHPNVFEKAKQEEEFVCSVMTINILPNRDELIQNAIPYGTKHLEEIIETYFKYDENLTKNWDVYMAIEYDMNERPDKVIFVGEQWETELASKYFGDGMLETVE